jgi:hypothetical protein
MNNTVWREQFLESIFNCSSEGREAVEYIRAHKTHIAIKRARKSVGAFWTLSKAVYLNSVYFSHETSIGDPNASAILIHEIRHLQQGWLTALSIYGELDAWQYQFRVLKNITGKQITPLLEEILSLPLNMERGNLQNVRRLMTQYAGKNYGANLLPLYPIHKEIKHWFTRRNN